MTNRDTRDTGPGDGMEGEHVGSPEEAFSVLGDETRLRILLELAHVVGEGNEEQGLSFSELRRRVGVEDSGRFNYHLDKLSGGFIEKSDDRYVARYPAMAVVSAVYAGTYGEASGEHRAESPWECPNCNRTLDIRYEKESLVLECPEHGLRLSYPTPPGAYQGRSLEELTDVVFSRTMSGMNLARQGICPRCWGVTVIEYPTEPTYGLDGEGSAQDDIVWAEVDCNRCWLQYDPPLQVLISSHPAVRGFYSEHGLDDAEALFGSRSTSNPEVSDLVLHESGGTTATFELGEDALAVDVDEGGRVTDVRRE